MKKKSKVQQRIENMSQQEMQQRWYAVRPRYIKGCVFFIISALGLFLANHFQHFEKPVLDIVNVAFQIICVFAVLFGTLTLMSFIHGKAPAKEIA